MPGYRPTAWLRPLMTLAALAAVLMLAACGGGNGAPNNAFNPQTTAPLAVFPATANVYSGTPVTVAITGGTGPFTAFSSDQGVLSVQQNVSGSSITLVPNQVTSDTPVTLTIRDAKGTVVTALLTVKAALLVNSLTLKPDNFASDCPSGTVNSTTPTDTSNSTWICSGQTGSLAARVQNGTGGGIPGEYVRFDVVQGAFEIFTQGPGQPTALARCYIVPTDQNGNAVVRILADASAQQQIVIVQASVLGTAPPPTTTPFCDPSTVPTTNDFVRGVFIIQNHSSVTGTAMSVVPSTVTITGPDTQTCSSGATASFYIFGGQPPYVINNSFPQALTISPSVVTTAGSGFNVTTNGFCVNPATIAITDAGGRQSTVTVINTFGTNPPATVITPNPIIVGPLPIPTLGCTAPTNTASILINGGGTITQQGTTTTVTPAKEFLVSTDRPDVLTITPTTVAPLTAVQLTRNAVGPTTSPTSTVTLTIFDGTQSTTFNVPVAATCP